MPVFCSFFFSIWFSPFYWFVWVNLCYGYESSIDQQISSPILACLLITFTILFDEKICNSNIVLIFILSFLSFALWVLFSQYFPSQMSWIYYANLFPAALSLLHPPVNGVREGPMCIFSHIHTYYCFLHCLYKGQIFHWSAPLNPVSRLSFLSPLGYLNYSTLS